MRKYFLMVLAVVALFATSCKREDPVVTSQATATAKMLDGGKFFFEVDENLAFVASNMKSFPFDPSVKEQRVAFLYAENEGETPASVPGYATTKSVTIYACEKTLTKDPEVYDSGKTYKSDFVGLYLTQVFPTTMIEDGYLSVSFAMPYLTGSIAHELTLLTNVDPADPYTVKFVHDSKGDFGPNRIAGLVCFPLKSLPDTEGKTVKLTLKWDSIVSEQEESVKFDYCTRTDWPE